MTLLDEVSGFGFEDVMVRVFERQGYENVRRAPQVADLGDTVEECRACDDDTAEAYTFCPNFGAIVCPDHTRT